MKEYNTDPLMSYWERWARDIINNGKFFDVVETFKNAKINLAARKVALAQEEKDLQNKIDALNKLTSI